MRKNGASKTSPPSRLECQLRCGNLGNPQWHDLCSRCFCTYALRPALTAEAFAPGLARVVRPELLGAAGDATSDASPASPWRARLAPRGAVSADGGAARALAALGTMQAGVHIFSVVFNEGYESLWTNPLIGPNGTSLYRCGALFVDGGQHWRMMSSLFLSTGAVQLVPGLFLQWTLGKFVEQRLGFWRMLQVLLLSGASGSLLSAWGQLNTRRLIVGSSLPLHGVLAQRLCMPPVGAEERLYWRVSALVLLLSLSFAALLPILDFQGRLGATLGGLLSALGTGGTTGSKTVLAAKALAIVLGLTLWTLSIVDLIHCSCNVPPSDVELRIVAA